MDKLLRKLKYNYNTWMDQKILYLLKDSRGIEEIRGIQKQAIKKSILITMGTVVLVFLILLVLYPRKTVERSEAVIVGDQIDFVSFEEQDKVANVEVNLESGKIAKTFESGIILPHFEPTDEEVVDRLLAVINRDLIKNKNKNLEEVRTDLFLPTKNQYEAQIRWESSGNYVDMTSGQVTRSPKGYQDKKIKLYLYVTKNNVTKRKTFNLIIKESEMTVDEDNVYKAQSDLLEKIKNGHYYEKETGKLITDLHHTKVGWIPKDIVKKEKDIRAFLIILLLAIYFCLIIRDYSKLKRKEEIRKEEIEMRLPYFLTKLILLLNVGFTITRAWEYISSHHVTQDALMKEVIRTHEQIKSGEFQKNAYQNFAKRTGSRKIKKVISNIVYNIRRGDAELINSLRHELTDALLYKKNRIKVRAEENSVKLIFPMVLIFIAILLLIMYPAVVSISA